MDNRIFNAIDEIEHYIDHQKNNFLSNNMISVDKQLIFDMLQNIKETLPGELEVSRKLLNNRDEIINKANKELELAKEKSTRELEKAKEQINREIENAKAKRAELLDNHDIIREAKELAERIKNDARKEANLIISNAEERAERLKNDNEQMMDEALKNTQEYINDFTFDEVSKIYTIIEKIKYVTEEHSAAIKTNLETIKELSDNINNIKNDLKKN